MTGRELADLARRAAERYIALSVEERAVQDEAQRQSWVRGEIGMGSDADEAAYRRAVDEVDALEAAAAHARALIAYRNAVVEFEA